MLASTVWASDSPGVSSVSTMSRSKQGQGERNAGAFLGPDMLVPAPIRTLSDDYRDEPTEPEDSDREPEPESPSLISRVLDQLTRRPKSRPDG